MFVLRFGRKWSINHRAIYTYSNTGVFWNKIVKWSVGHFFLLSGWVTCFRRHLKFSVILLKRFLPLQSTYTRHHLVPPPPFPPHTARDKKSLILPQTTFWDRSWLRHCTTIRKVAGSIPEGVTRMFQWLNPSGRIVALRSTQPVTEMSTTNPSWG
jgi:hypothetical protein